MREGTSSLELERTRAAFDCWRATQPRRRRLPEHLWLQALSLLDRYSISRVARELRLDPKQLRQRKLSIAQPLRSNSATGPSFIELRATDLNVGASAPVSRFNPSHHTADMVARLIFERIDGSRLTLSLPASDWDHITALCTSFMRS